MQRNAPLLHKICIYIDPAGYCQKNLFCLIKISLVQPLPGYTYSLLPVKGGLKLFPIIPCDSFFFGQMTLCVLVSCFGQTHNQYVDVNKI